MGESIYGRSKPRTPFEQRLADREARMRATDPRFLKEAADRARRESGAAPSLK